MVAGWRPADDVEVGPDQSLLYLLQIFVQRNDVSLEPFRPRVVVPVYAEILEDVVPLDSIIDLRYQALLHRLGRAALEFEIVLQLDADLLEIAVRITSGHGRRHVAYQDGLGPPLGLNPLAGIVHGVRVQVRDSVQDVVRVAFVGKAHVQSRKPFQGAVGAHVEYHVRLEDVPYPPVVGVVLVLGEQEGIVDVLLHVLRPAPHGLIADEHVALEQSRDYDLPAIGHYLTCRGPPGGFRHGTVPFRDPGVLRFVVLLLDQVRGLFYDGCRGLVVQIVRDVVQDLLHERASVDRTIRHLVS